MTWCACWAVSVSTTIRNCSTSRLSSLSITLLPAPLLLLPATALPSTDSSGSDSIVRGDNFFSGRKEGTADRASVVGYSSRKPSISIVAVSLLRRRRTKKNTTTTRISPAKVPKIPPRIDGSREDEVELWSRRGPEGKVIARSGKLFGNRLVNTLKRQQGDTLTSKQGKKILLPSQDSLPLWWLPHREADNLQGSHLTLTVRKTLRVLDRSMYPFHHWWNWRCFLQRGASNLESMRSRISWEANETYELWLSAAHYYRKVTRIFELSQI